MSRTYTLPQLAALEYLGPEDLYEGLVRHGLPESTVQYLLHFKYEGATIFSLCLDEPGIVPTLESLITELIPLTQAEMEAQSTLSKEETKDG